MSPLGVRVNRGAFSSTVGMLCFSTNLEDMLLNFFPICYCNYFLEMNISHNDDSKFFEILYSLGYFKIYSIVDHKIIIVIGKLGQNLHRCTQHHSFVP
jgi:hypothetical protein